MTLNLMLTSPNAVYLSGDFRLTYIGTGAYRDDHETQKLIPVIKFGWGVLIAYTGLASAPPPYRELGDWISAQADSVPREAPYAVLQQRLLQIQSWLNRWRANYKLTISIVGFIGRRPFMEIITNDRDFDGKPTLSRDLTVITRRPKSISVRAAGDLSAVNQDELQELKRLLVQNTSRDLSERLKTSEMRRGRAHLRHDQIPTSVPNRFE